jgi:hypothetical protein
MNTFSVMEDLQKNKINKSYNVLKGFNCWIYYSENTRRQIR